MSCAFSVCDPTACVLPGGCVPMRFWRQVQQQRAAEQARVRAPRRAVKSRTEQRRGLR